MVAVLFDIPEQSAEENEERMLSEMEQIRSGEVTYAVRDTVIDDKTIHAGDYMGIGDEGILAVNDSLPDTFLGMLREMVDADSALLSMYYGCDVSEEDANLLAEKARKEFPQLEVELQEGGQPVYYYVISVE